MDYKYKITIIMSIYNVEKYIKEAVDSVINQDIGFEDNVQIVMVNDGSKDNSEKTCLEYKEKYPNNIEYVYKENGGLSSARNEGLKHRKGKYVNFFDPDDILSKNALSEVYNFFEANYDKTNLVSIPLIYFGAEEGLHPKYELMPNKNTIINLEEEPALFVLSSASAFYKTEVFDSLSYDPKMFGSEDLKLNMLIYKKLPTVGYVCENKVIYHYRKREEQNSMVDRVKANPEGYKGVYYNFDETITKDCLKDYEKEIIIYELRARLKNIIPECFASEQEYNEVMNKYKYYISRIEDDFIINKSAYTKSLLFKLLLLKIKHDRLEKNREYILKDMPKAVHIKYHRIKDNIIELDTLYHTYKLAGVELVIKDSNGKEIKPCLVKEVDCSYNFSLGDFVIDNAQFARFKIKFNKVNKYKFYFKYNGTYYPLTVIKTNQRLAFALRGKGIRVFNKEYSLNINKEEIVVKKDKTTNLKYKIITTLSMLKNRKYLALYRLFNQREKKHILIYDRPEKAGDNGEALYTYICNNRKELAKDTYFVISKKSKDYKRIKKIGKVVHPKSIKHKILFMNTKVIYTSHTHPLFINAFENEVYKYYADMLDFKLVWLQHGITQNDISKSANRLSNIASCFVTATVKETEEIKSDKYFYFDKEVAFTGFARFDKLYNKPQNIISIIPTWRNDLSGPVLPNGFHEPKEGFEESKYYKNYSNILSDKKLNEMLKKNNYKINFVLHPGMTAYENLFTKFANEQINIVSPKEANYTDIFATSKLLITDYSSVFFDFAYLKKPAIYFQFDRDEFYAKHYKPGYFKFESDAFGDVITEYDKVIEKIEYYFNNKFKVEDKYKTRIKNTFKYIDKKNSKRILDYVEKNIL